MAVHVSNVPVIEQLALAVLVIDEVVTITNATVVEKHMVLVALL